MLDELLGLCSYFVSRHWCRRDKERVMARDFHGQGPVQLAVGDPASAGGLD